MKDGVSGFFRGIGGTKEVCYSGKDMIIRAPSIDDADCPFDRIGSFRFLFYLILFSAIIGHNAALGLLYCGRVDIWGGI